MSTGVSFGELLAWLLATVGLGFVCMLMYKRYLKLGLFSGYYGLLSGFPSIGF